MLVGGKVCEYEKESVFCGYGWFWYKICVYKLWNLIILGYVLSKFRWIFMLGRWFKIVFYIILVSRIWVLGYFMILFDKEKNKKKIYLLFVEEEEGFLLCKRLIKFVKLFIYIRLGRFFFEWIIFCCCLMRCWW